MADEFPHKLLDDAATLASFEGWSEEVYRDFLKLQRDQMTEQQFARKYCWQRAILCLDMTGFTSSAMRLGELPSLLRILDAQKVCIPVLQEHGSGLIRCFADDIVALFEDPDAALDAAFELHRRVEQFNASAMACEEPTACCVGIGYGRVFAIGPNLAQGDEMNKAAKLGEDIARANETLLTECAREALRHREDVCFAPQLEDDQLFPYYKATVDTD